MAQGASGVGQLNEAQFVVLEWFLHVRAMGYSAKQAVEHIENMVGVSSNTFDNLQKAKFRTYLLEYGDGEPEEDKEDNGRFWHLVRSAVLEKAGPAIEEKFTSMVELLTQTTGHRVHRVKIGLEPPFYVKTEVAVTEEYPERR